MAELLNQEPESWRPFVLLPLLYSVMCVLTEQPVLPLPSPMYLFNRSHQRGPIRDFL